MDDEKKEKYKRLKYQLKDVVNLLDDSMEKLNIFKNDVKDNYKLNKKIAYKEDFDEIYDINKGILNDIENLYNIVSNKSN